MTTINEKFTVFARLARITTGVAAESLPFTSVTVYGFGDDNIDIQVATLADVKRWADVYAYNGDICRLNEGDTFARFMHEFEGGITLEVWAELTSEQMADVTVREP